ncbi:helix-turn-helix transcriptional regulator [Laspinema olomoucense]|uniref:NB-ARC domain-containing protein n=1 Tax=Laspinema olomoucense D3b TaxID=2953688 RepID=A0ABT2N149_9CYAN|nr:MULTISPECIES: NB-ARC domain-containing protein [unclassified Laspinema]MCT7971921.1 NB-ARC domain-containing protein [Laspinema sp. D3d]MCT7976393.1 NB-ARC domain-containing protein [Laspinema sp. D3b]MCT7987108.1 NB-ARC domain-containing protein [Laspinema sp. D3a]MCT7994624.1 NB-ARC domain-containing protein [Laspinema sp. D3c]
MIPQDFLKVVTVERGVSDSEIQVLSYALHGESIAAIAINLGIRPEAVRKRLGEVYKKFKIGGAGPGKMAKLQQILVSEYQDHQTGITLKSNGLLNGSASCVKSIYDWGEAPDSSIFYGRELELATLKQWILEQECRVVSILGMAGMGKTALSVKLAHQLQDQFDSVLWRNLHQGPPLSDLLDNLLKLIYPHQSAYSVPELNDKISLLLEYCRRHRCLLILDGVETLLQGGELSGQYRAGYEEYGDFFKRLSCQPHKSCVLMTSWENPKEISLQEGDYLPVRSLQLTGLNAEASTQILKDKGLIAEPAWANLFDLYRGNPLELKIAARTIQELFGGQVAEFLKHGTLVFGEIGELLAQQCDRLSALEKEILYWLAIERQPLSLERLRQTMLLPVPLQELLEAVASLGRRSLLEKSADPHRALFCLQPVLLEYVTTALMSQIFEELREVFNTKKPEKFLLFRSHALVQPEAEPLVQQQQLYQIITPLGDRLRRTIRSESRIVDYLTQIDTLLQGEPTLEVGYSSKNVKSLLKSLQPEKERLSDRA